MLPVFHWFVHYLAFSIFGLTFVLVLSLLMALVFFSRLAFCDLHFSHYVIGRRGLLLKLTFCSFTCLPLNVKLLLDNGDDDREKNKITGTQSKVSDLLHFLALSEMLRLLEPFPVCEALFNPNLHLSWGTVALYTASSGAVAPIVLILQPILTREPG